MKFPARPLWWLVFWSFAPIRSPGVDYVSAPYVPEITPNNRVLSNERTNRLEGAVVRRVLLGSWKNPFVRDNIRFLVRGADEE